MDDVRTPPRLAAASTLRVAVTLLAVNGASSSPPICA